jgi:hypothetical protein
MLFSGQIERRAPQLYGCVSSRSLHLQSVKRSTHKTKTPRSQSWLRHLHHPLPSHLPPLTLFRHLPQHLRATRHNQCRVVLTPSSRSVTSHSQVRDKTKTRRRWMLLDFRAFKERVKSEFSFWIND